MNYQYDEEDLNKPLNDPQYHHKDDENSLYEYEDDEDIMGSWEAEYAAMDDE